jgi:hypothetical protein
MIHPDGQAGASANLQIPDGLIVTDLEVAEDIVLEWQESGDYRAIDVVIKVYEYLTEAALARSSGSS